MIRARVIQVSRKQIILTMAFILAVASFLFFRYQYQYHLFFTEQMQLFMLTWSHFGGYFEKPAAIASYLGDFLVQFYYLRGGGAIVITSVLLLIWILVWTIIKRITPENNWQLFTVLPTCSIGLLHLHISYPLSLSIAFVLVLGLVVLYSNLKFKAMRILIAGVMAFTGYWLIGYYYLLFFIIALFLEIFIYKQFRFKHYVLLLSFSVFALLIPFALRLYFALTYNQIFAYPILDVNIPILFLLAPALTTFLVVIFCIFLNFKWTCKSVIFQILIVVIFTFGGFNKLANFDLERTLSIDSELYFNNISKARQLSVRHSLKSSAGAYYYNLVNAISGTLPDRFFSGSQTGVKGLFLPVDYQQNYITITFSNEVFYYLGDVNASQHFALLATIFSPKQQSSRLMRRLIQINIVNGEYALAEKYIEILKQTIFHKKWALAVEPLLYDEGLRNQSIWITQKRSLMPHSNIIKKSNDYETSLKLLLESNPDNYLASDYLLCLYLMQKNLNDFFNLYSSFILENPDNRIPELYQQALLIVNARFPGHPVWAKAKIDASIIQRFSQYTSQFEQHLGNGEFLLKEFESTYWFYYHYAKVDDEE